VRELKDTVEVIQGHSYLYKQILNLANQEVYAIEEVQHRWFKGYYVCLVIKRNKQRQIIQWENINCEDYFIQSQIETINCKFKLIDWQEDITMKKLSKDKQL
jgi:hypothetical protein